MLKQAYLDELNKIVKESHKANLDGKLPVSQAAYVALRFESLTNYAILDPEITPEEYDEVLTKAKDFIEFLASK